MWNNKKFVYNLEKSKTLGHGSLHGIFFYCIDNNQDEILQRGYSADKI